MKGASTLRPARGLSINRYFTHPGESVYEQLEWTTRSSIITEPDGRIVFKAENVEVPSTWSQLATDILASKYFRRAGVKDPKTGQLGPETSARQVVSRIATTFRKFGEQYGYFASAEDAQSFEDELTYLLITQRAAFNSPVWFNVGHYHYHNIVKDGDNWAWNMEAGGVELQENYYLRPQGAACQPYHALVSTPKGMVPIGELVERNAVGTEVYDAYGVTRVVATKKNGQKEVFRVSLKNGSFIEATADHLVKAVAARREAPSWLELKDLRPGMRLHLYPHVARTASAAPRPATGHQIIAASGGNLQLASAEMLQRFEAEAALAGWLQADGFVGEYEGTNRSLTMEFMTINAEEHEWVLGNLDQVLPSVHRNIIDVPSKDPALAVKRIRLYGEELRQFVYAWELQRRGTEIRAPKVLWTAPASVVSAYLKSVFQGDGFVSNAKTATGEQSKIGLTTISEKWMEDIQILLLSLGIYGRRITKTERRPDRKQQRNLSIGNGSERARFASAIGFVSREKTGKLAEGLQFQSPKNVPDLREEEIVEIRSLGVMDVFDIQTESGEYLSNNIAVHNCFINRVEDTINGPMGIMELVAKEARLFKGGSGTGTNFSRVRGKDEPLSSGGKSSGLLSFLKILDANAGSVKSGGTTRRAAKMVIVDVDHPDIEEFVQWKAHEERKAKILLENGVGLDSQGRPDFNGEAYQTVSGQNSNNSVRVTDAFMNAVKADQDWTLVPRTGKGTPKVVKAKDLWGKINQAAWECADPGVQYDDTIQKWHTCKNTDRIYATNPCFPAGTRILTDQGILPIERVVEMVRTKEPLKVYTSTATAPGARLLQLSLVATTPVHAEMTGVKQIVRLTFSNGAELRCTPNHGIFTTNRGMVPAGELTGKDEILFAVDETAFGGPAEIPVSSDPLDYNPHYRTKAPPVLPKTWTPELGRLLGHLVGDGSISKTSHQVSWVYGDEQEWLELGLKHQTFLEDLGFHTQKHAMKNGTVQLVVTNRVLKSWLVALGVLAVDSHEKQVPASIFRAPKEAVRGFLQGLLSADGCVSSQPDSRYVGLGSASVQLVRDAQQLLFAFGVYGRIYDMKNHENRGFTYVTKAGEARTYQSRDHYDLRISADNVVRFSERVGFADVTKRARLEDILETHRFYQSAPIATLVSRVEDGEEPVYNLTEPLHHTYTANGVVVRNCSEFVFLDETSCNLASVNLMKFFDDALGFDVEAYRHANRVMFIAQEIGVDLFSYPSKTIAEMTHKTRPLGLGYANLGTLLMCMGMPYNGPEGRAIAGAITGLMHGEAFLASTEMAKVKGPFELYEENRKPFLEVMSMHREAAYNVLATGSPIPSQMPGARPERWFEPIAKAATEVWDQVLEQGKKHGFRNAQATVLAPTGTIGLLMDCDTTGVEPEFSLVKWKKLAGGGYFQIINQSVPRALRNMGYSDKQVLEIEAHVVGKKDATGKIIEQGKETVEGAPGLKAEHYAVFDCANRCGDGVRFIHPDGHLNMMAAVQPFLSGAISKTVNLPSDVTVDDIGKTYELGWKLGLKAVALYRDGCKASQPLNTKKQKSTTEAEAPAKAAEPTGPKWGDLVKLPKFTDNLIKREVTVFDNKLGNVKVHVMFREDPRGRLMEIFLTVGKNGSSIHELCRDLGIAWSKQLRLGHSSRELAMDLLNEYGSVAGMTDHPLIKSCLSVKDLMGKLILYEYHGTTDFLNPELLQSYQESLDYVAPRHKVVAELNELRALKETRKEKPLTVFVDLKPATGGAMSETVDPNELAAKFMGDAPDCDVCGYKTVRNAACYKCLNCGNSMGCS